MAVGRFEGILRTRSLYYKAVSSKNLPVMLGASIEHPLRGDFSVFLHLCFHYVYICWKVTVKLFNCTVIIIINESN